MSVKENLTAILGELSGYADRLDCSQFSELIACMLQARHIFLAGVGLSGLAMQGFAGRLMQLGMSVSVVGDPTSPHTEPNDLLIIGSGSGDTERMVMLANRTIGRRVQVALLTMNPKADIAREATAVIVLPCVLPKLGYTQPRFHSVESFDTAFEQMLCLVCDAIVLELMPLLHETLGSMCERHADFE